MRRASGHPDVGALRRFDQLSKVDTGRLAELAQQVEVHEADSGTALVELDSREPITVYLLNGEVRLEAHDGHIRTITHKDPAARNPLCRLRPTRWRALAAGPVRYLQIQDDLLEEFLGSTEAETVQVGYSVLEVSADNVDHDSAANEGNLLFRLYDDLNRNRLVLRSLPRVARNIGRLIADMEDDPFRVEQLLMLDPVLAIKILRAASTPPIGPTIARSCAKAAKRLGHSGTHRILVQCTLLESFRPDNAALNFRMHEWRERSLIISTLSRMLADMTAEFDPGFAALVGLTQGLGEAAILSYADRHSELDSDLEVLDACITTQSADAGRMLLGRWPLPAELANAAGSAGSWWRTTSGNRADYVDIALVAQLLALQHKGRPGLPTLGTLPAARRLGVDTLSPERMSTLLKKAQTSLAEAEELLKA